MTTPAVKPGFDHAVGMPRRVVGGRCAHRAVDVTGGHGRRWRARNPCQLDLVATRRQDDPHPAGVVAVVVGEPEGRGVHIVSPGSRDAVIGVVDVIRPAGDRGRLVAVGALEVDIHVGVEDVRVGVGDDIRVRRLLVTDRAEV